MNAEEALKEIVQKTDQALEGLHLKALEWVRGDLLEIRDIAQGQANET